MSTKNEANWGRSVRQYLEGYDAALARSLKGWSDSEVRELEGAIGRSVPYCYREFLTSFADPEAGLFAFNSLDVSFDAVVEEAQRLRGEFGAEVFRSVLPLGFCPYVEGIVVEAAGEDAGRVVLRRDRDADPDSTPISGSLHGFAFRAVFRRRMRSLSDSVATFRSPESRVEHVADALDRLGFEREAYWDTVQSFGHNRDVLYSVRSTSSGFPIEILFSSKVRSFALASARELRKHIAGTLPAMQPWL